MILEAPKIFSIALLSDSALIVVLIFQHRRRFARSSGQVYERWVCGQLSSSRYGTTDFAFCPCLFEDTQM